MDFSKSTQWKFPGKNFAFKNCEDASTFDAIGEWESVPTKQEIEDAYTEYEAHQNAILFFDTGLGFKIRTDDSTAASMSLLSSAISARLVDRPLDVFDVSLYDSDGVKRAITLQQFKSMTSLYGQYCLSIRGL